MLGLWCLVKTFESTVFSGVVSALSSLQGSIFHIQLFEIRRTVPPTFLEIGVSCLGPVKSFRALLLYFKIVCCSLSPHIPSAPKSECSTVTTAISIAPPNLSGLIPQSQVAIASCDWQTLALVISFCDLKTRHATLCAGNPCDCSLQL